MKVQIIEKYVYHKVTTKEVEIDKDEYEKYLDDNKGCHSLDDYLSLEHEELWVEKIDNVKPIVVDREDFSLSYYCEELQTGGHL